LGCVDYWLLGIETQPLDNERLTRYIDDQMAGEVRILEKLRSGELVAMGFDPAPKGSEAFALFGSVAHTSLENDRK
jgi:hypothetical protein